MPYFFGLAVVIAVVVFMAKKSKDTPRETVSPGSRLSAQDVYNLARWAGFPPETARVMTAIAKRESGYNPRAVCRDCFPGIREYSLGLWQINMFGQLGQSRMVQFGLSSPEQLLNPRENAKAAFKIWSGNDKNIEIAWAINKSGNYQYQEKYQQALASLPNLGTLESTYSTGGASSAYPV